MRLGLMVTMAALLFRGAAAFTPYYENGTLFRWDLNYTGYSTNIFNSNTKAIRYYLGSQTYSAANRTAELNAIRAAFAQWQAIVGTAIKFEELGVITNPSFTLEDGTNCVFFSKFSRLTNTVTHDVVEMGAKAGLTFWGANGGRIDAADIALNAAGYQWITDFEGTNAGGQFVEAIALHEIGHMLGLDHTPLGAGCMINGSEGIGPTAGLSSDDIAAARFLYPAAGIGGQVGTIAGTVRMNGAGIRGAMVTAEDANGFAVAATLSLTGGAYSLPALPPGTYKVRVSPLDPAGRPTSQSLFKPEDIYDQYGAAVTAFRAAENVNVTVTGGGTATQDFAVTAGEPTLRIQQLSKPTQLQGAPSAFRTAIGAYPGQSFFTGVASSTLTVDAVFSITGGGVTVGTNIFEANRVSGMNLLQAQVSVAADAAPGIRSFVVRRGSEVAYANGYFEVLSTAPDYNFDGLDDRFQRRYFPIFTAVEAAPGSDPDGDRFSNAFEAATGSNPTNSLSFNFFIDRVTANASGATVFWKSDVGKQYRVEGRRNFETANWGEIGVVTAAGASAQLFDAGMVSNKFYRLRLLP